MDAALQLPRRQLVALRLRLRKLKEEREQAERHWERFWRPLFSTMAQEHIVHVCEEIGALDDGERDYFSFSALTRHVLGMDGAARWSTLQGPLALPPEVAQVYLDDRDAWAAHDCEDCGYPVPVRTGKSLQRYFERCPLCGGRTGYSAYYLKHGQPERQGQEVAADAEEDALLAALLASVGQEVAGSVEDRESSPTAAEPVPSDVFAASGWAGVSV